MPSWGMQYYVKFILQRRVQGKNTCGHLEELSFWILNNHLYTKDVFIREWNEGGGSMYVYFYYTRGGGASTIQWEERAFWRRIMEYLKLSWIYSLEKEYESHPF